MDLWYDDAAIRQLCRLKAAIDAERVASFVVLALSAGRCSRHFCRELRKRLAAALGLQIAVPMSHVPVTIWCDIAKRSTA